MSAADPGLDGVLETCVYCAAAEREEVERFYTETLGLEAVSRWPDGIALRIGAGVLLLFERERLAEREGPIARHGTSGPGHVCFLAAGSDGYEAWRGHLERAGVEITHEHGWGEGRHSIYFEDPAGNLIEIADGDLWPSAKAS